MNLKGHAQMNSGPLSQKKKKILCCTFCLSVNYFCLFMLETQIVQFVQLENLAFILGCPQKYKLTKLLRTHQNALVGTLNSLTLTSATRGNRGGKKSLLFFQKE